MSDGPKTLRCIHAVALIASVLLLPTLEGCDRPDSVTATTSKIGGPTTPQPRPRGTPELPGATVTMTVQNDYPTAQYIFFDGRTLLGVVEPGQEGAFRVPAGSHTFTSADSADPNDNPQHSQVDLRRGVPSAWRVAVVRR